MDSNVPLQTSTKSDVDLQSPHSAGSGRSHHLKMRPPPSGKTPSRPRSRSRSQSPSSKRSISDRAANYWENEWTKALENAVDDLVSRDFPLNLYSNVCENVRTYLKYDMLLNIFFIPKIERKVVRLSFLYFLSNFVRAEISPVTVLKVHKLLESNNDSLTQRFPETRSVS